MARLQSLPSNSRSTFASAIRFLKRKKALGLLNQAIAKVEFLEDRRLLSTVTLHESPVTVNLGAHGTPFAVQAVDLNGDGINDLITANSDGTVSVAYGNGNGTFQTPFTVSDGLGNGTGTASDLAITSVNNGGIKTIFVANGHSGTVAAMSTNGQGHLLLLSDVGTFAPATHNISALAVGNIEGTLSLVAADNLGIVTVGGFATPTSTTGFQGFDTPLVRLGTVLGSGSSTLALAGVAVGSFASGSNSTNQDIVVSASTAFFVFSSSGDGTAGDAPVQLAATTSGGGDGLYSTTGNGTYNNIITRYGGKYASALEGGNGGGGFESETVNTINGGDHIVVGTAGSIAVGDFEGDGVNNDFAITDGDGTQKLYSGSTGGIFSETYSGPGIGGASALAAADLNGSGQNSLLVGSLQGTLTTVNVFTNQTPSAVAITNIDNIATGVNNQGEESPVSAGVFTDVIAQGAPVDLVVQTTGFPLASVTATGLPSGLSFFSNGDGTGTIFGTASKTTKAVSTIALHATNTTGGTVNTVNATLFLEVAQEPTFTSASHAQFTFGRSNSFTFTTSGGQPSVTFKLVSVDNDPTQNFVGSSSPYTFNGLTLMDNGNGTARLFGDPASISELGSLGVHTFQIQALVPGLAAVSENFTLTENSHPIIAVYNDASGPPPIAMPTGSALLTVNQPATLEIDTASLFENNVETLAAFPINSSISISGNLPAGLSFQSGSDGKAWITGTPTSPTFGANTITINANNSAGSATPVTFVIEVDQQPQFTSLGAAAFTVGQNSSFTISASGSTGVGHPSFNSALNASNGIVSSNVGTVSGLPTGLTLTSSTNGTAAIHGTPAAGTGGSYVLTLETASDSSSTPTTFAGAGLTAATQTFFLTVRQPAAFTLGTSATDPNTNIVGTPITPVSIDTTGFPSASITASNVPKGLTFTNNGDGSCTITGTPLAGSPGANVITLSATNGSGTTAKLAYTMNIEQVPGLSGVTGTTLKTVTLTHGHTTNQSLGNYTGFPIGKNGGTNNVTIDVLGGLTSSGLSLVNNSTGTGLVLSGDPVTGDYTVTFTLINAAGTSATYTLQINVS